MATPTKCRGDLGSTRVRESAPPRAVHLDLDLHLAGFEGIHLDRVDEATRAGRAGAEETHGGLLAVVSRRAS